MAHLRHFFLALLLAAGCALSASAAPIASKDVPPVLKEWMAWVLHEEPEYFCPPVFNSPKPRLCNWPSRLVLDVSTTGARFELQAANFIPGWVSLPGGGSHWPVEVKAGTESLAVTARANTPEVWLDAGVHKIAGKFSWSDLPEVLQLPAEVGLVRLRRGGKEVIHPQRGPANLLRLGQRSSRAKAQSDRLKLRVFRLLDDDIPFQVTTQIELDVGGQVREELIGPVLPSGLLPLTLSGGLPARLEADGRLRVQLRPGRWNLTLVARSKAPVASLARPQMSDQSIWPDEEIWSLQTRPELRIVEAGGAVAIDPRQSGVPAQWQSFAAFLVGSDAALQLKEIRRGSPGIAPDELTLSRQLWLDFDGQGFALQDELRGRLADKWRLNAAAPVALGSVKVDGEPQLITQHDGDTGVEVRHGNLNLVAESRIDAPLRQLPAGGWNSDLQHITTVLHLPPAWRLLAVSGVDQVSETWVARWTLLDLFLVLIVSIAALRLFGWGAGVLTLITLILTWHVPGAPRGVWLSLIAAIALLRALPESISTDSRLYRLLHTYKWLSLAALILVAVPFALEQARSSLFPQLENTEAVAQGRVSGAVAAAGDDAVPEEATMAAPAQRMMDSAEQYYSKARSLPAKISGPATAPRRQLHQLDPGALVQTGPGLPEWQWRRAELSWSGPVTADQTYRVWLLPPALSRATGWISIVLVALLAASWMQLPLRIPRALSGGWLLALGIGIATVMPNSSFAAGEAIPSSEMLEELKQRITAPPDCMPGCGDWSRMHIGLKGETLLLRLRGEALTGTALPLPVAQLVQGQARVWQPRQVFLDGRDAAVRRDEAGTLWVQLPSGQHEVLVVGSLRGFDEVALTMVRAPREVDYTVPGWLVTGVDSRGQPGRVIKLNREKPHIASNAAVTAVAAAQDLPELVRLQRRFELGLQWQVQTTLQRMGDARGTYIAQIDALPGEVVTGANVRVVDNKVVATFGPGQRHISWRSGIDIKQTIELTANPGSAVIETWQLDISPLWHAAFSGIPAISNQQDDWRLVTFRPWPGESVLATIARPAGVSGAVLTLENIALETRPARRATDHQLRFSLRSSQGGQHVLPLPADIEVQSLQVNGKTQPVRREGGNIVLPLAPGQQNILLQLRDNNTLTYLSSTPDLSPGLSGVNASISLQLPRDRWVLYAGGPSLGPAVMFWGVLAVLLVIGLLLGKVHLTPLNSWQWVLLMVGLSQLPVFDAAIVVGWLLALGLRSRVPASWSARQFNMVQLVLGLWTLVALTTLFAAVAQGLLGSPDMQIAGNGSSAFNLHWYQDRFDQSLPVAWALSVSIWVYRLLMLLWALWLANALLNWLRWGWVQFSSDGIWKKSVPKSTMM